MKKILIAVLAGLFVVGVSVAQDGTTLSAAAAAGRVNSVNQEQSKLPDAQSRFGYLVAKYDFAVEGGSGTIELGPTLPDNTLIVGGYAQVIVPILPATCTNSIGVESTGDLLATGTSLNSAGLVNLIPQAGTSAFVTGVTAQSDTNGFMTNIVVATSSASTAVTPVAVDGTSEKVELVLSGSVATQGVVFVYLDLLQGQ